VYFYIIKHILLNAKRIFKQVLNNSFKSLFLIIAEMRIDFIICWYIFCLACNTSISEYALHLPICVSYDMREIRFYYDKAIFSQIWRERNTAHVILLGNSLLHNTAYKPIARKENIHSKKTPYRRDLIKT